MSIQLQTFAPENSAELQAMADGPIRSWSIRRRRLLHASVGIALICAALTFAHLIGLRVNLTTSQPLGFYRVVSAPQTVQAGDRVLVCPPNEGVFALARDRGYLPTGPCPSGLTPLLKTVAALPGDKIEIDAVVRINGQVIIDTDVVSVDDEGRALPRAEGSLLGPGKVFLLSNAAPHGFDSRYFGAVPEGWIIGRIEPVWTLGHAR